MNVLVTGGTGTISSSIVEECIRRGYKTCAITRGNMKYREVIGAEYLYGDIWNKTQISALLDKRKFNVVVECLVYTEEQLKVSLENFQNRTDVYVFISTGGIYKRSNEHITEKSELIESGWWYTDNKIKCENYLREYAMKTGLKYMIIRPSITYGKFRIPFPIATRNPGWTFFQRLLEKRPMLACENVRAQMVYETDFAKCVVNLLENEKAINEDFNVALNDEVYWDDVIYMAGDILGVKPVIIHAPLNVFKNSYPQVYDEIKWNKVTDLIMDGRKIKDASGMKSGEISIYDGLYKIINYMRDDYKNNNLKLDDSWNEQCDRTINAMQHYGKCE